MKVLAFDIGGSRLVAGLVTAEGELLGSATCPTDPQAPPKQVLARLLELAREATDAARLPWEEAARVGLSYGGPVDFLKGRTITNHHLPGWEDFRLREEMTAQVGRPVIMDNDANAAALGETAFGAARACRHVLYVTVSTGIGAGLVLDGRVYRGAATLAGELGHTLVEPDGPLCTCGRRGCLESVASGPAIARTAQDALRAGHPSSLLPEGLTSKEIAAAAATDALAARLMARAGHYLGVAIAGAVNLLNPEAVVIGGGVSQSGDPLFTPLRNALQEHGVPECVQDLRLTPAALGPHSALLGAAALALEG